MAAAQETLLVIIREIDDLGYCHVEDRFGKMRRVNMGIVRHKGLRPQVGESWLLRRDLDGQEWTFAAVLAASVTPPVVSGSRSDGTALGSLLAALEAHGVITDETTA